MVVEQIRSANIIQLKNHKFKQRLSYQSVSSLNETDRASGSSPIFSKKSNNNNTEIYESFHSSENDLDRLEDIQGFGKYFILRELKPAKEPLFRATMLSNEVVDYD